MADKGNRGITKLSVTTFLLFQMFNVSEQEQNDDKSFCDHWINLNLQIDCLTRVDHEDGVL